MPRKRETPVAQCKDIQDSPRAAFWTSNASYFKAILFDGSSYPHFHERTSDLEEKGKSCFDQEHRSMPPPIRWRSFSPCLQGSQSPDTGTTLVWRSC